MQRKYLLFFSMIVILFFGGKETVFAGNTIDIERGTVSYIAWTVTLAGACAPSTTYPDPNTPSVSLRDAWMSGVGGASSGAIFLPPANNVGTWTFTCTHIATALDTATPSDTSTLNVRDCPFYGKTWDGSTCTTARTVTFDANGGSGSMANQVASVSTALTANSYTRAGYTFNGWNTVAGAGGTAYADSAAYSFAANATLYAQWTALPVYTLTFDGWGSTGGATALMNIPQGNTVPLNLNGYTRTGFTFNGWSTIAGGGGTLYADGANYTMGGANATLYARWVAVPVYTLTFNGNGADGGATPLMNIAQGATTPLNLNGFTRTGFNFNGWNTLAGGGGTAYGNGANYTMGGANATLYAQWTAVPAPVVTVTGATVNGGTGNGSRSAYYGEAATVNWAATNGATSCSVYRNAVLVGPYAYPGTSSYVTPALTADDNYRVDCTNGTLGTGNTITFIIPPVPTIVDATCPVPGNSMTLNWTLPGVYTETYVRAYRTPPAFIDWTSACSPAQVAPNGTCSVVVGTTFTMAATPGQQYYWYIHTKHANTNYSNSVGAGAPFTCTPTAPTVTATLNGAIAPVTIPSEGSFTLAMSSTDATACTWERISTNNLLVPSFAPAPIPVPLGGPFQLTPLLLSGWQGPVTVTHKFVCSNLSGSDSKSVVVTVNTPVPQITTNPVNNLAFGDVPLNNIRTMTFTMQNTGQIGSTLAGTVTTGSGRFVCTAGCVYNLAQGAPAQTVTMEFTPTANGTLSFPALFNGVAENTPINPLVLSGKGIPAVIMLPPSINFGSVPIIRTKDITFTIVNIGAGNLGPSTFGFAPLGGPYTCVSGATCAAGGINLNSGVVNTVTIRFTPTAAIVYPLYNGTLTGQPLYMVPINGTGAQPVFDVKER